MAVAVLAATMGNLESHDSSSESDESCVTNESTMTPPSLDGIGAKKRQRDQDPLIYAVPVKAGHVITDWSCSNCGCGLTVDIRLRPTEEEVEEEVDEEEEEQADQILPTTWRNKLWLIVEPTDDPPPVYAFLSALVAGVGIIFILISVVVFVIETHPDYYHDTPKELFYIEVTCMAYFTLELFLRTISTPKLVPFFTDRYTIIDVLSILPFYISLAIGGQTAEGLIVIRILRLMRVFRIFKVSKYSVEVNIVMGSLMGSLEGLYLLLFLIFLSTVLFSSAMYFVERETLQFDNITDRWFAWAEADPGSYRDVVPHVVQYYLDTYGLQGGPTPTVELLLNATVPRVKSVTPYQSILHASWWCLVTLTTVGYGDDVPSSVAGKFIAAVTMLCGTLVIAFPMVIIGQNFQESYKNHKRSTHTRELKRKPNMLRYLRSAKLRGSDMSLKGLDRDKLQAVRVSRQPSLASSFDRIGNMNMEQTPVVTPASPQNRNFSAFQLPPGPHPSQPVASPVHGRTQSLQVPINIVMPAPRKRVSSMSMPEHSGSYMDTPPPEEITSCPASPQSVRERTRQKNDDAKIAKCTNQIEALEGKIQQLIRLKAGRAKEAGNGM